ncbi:MAG: hypothetical protein V7647_819 [Acidobacteriota bacterium]|jgi:hypothetical protein
MMHTAVRRTAIALLATVAILGVPLPGHAAQRPNPARQGTSAAVQALPAPGDEHNAEDTRESLERVFEKYPPAVARVFKLDPSLMSSPSYLAPYPVLGTFLSQHPEVVHNPGYFLDRIDNQERFFNDPRRRDREEMLGVLAGIGVFIAFIVIVSVLTWLIRLIVTHRRWNRLSRVQFETHNKLLDRFTSNDELLAYVQTPAGRRFLESTPIPVEDAQRMSAPLSRILWSVQAGIVLLVLGAGFLQVSRQFANDPQQLFSVAGILSLAFGAGFIVSALAAYGLSRKLGLLDRPAADHA